MNASFILKSKSGISLIAVLMFMLAATTASVVVFRWLSSENFASGARLKQSEAYQASEAGLDAAYSWLTFNAADVGGVLGYYVYNKDGEGKLVKKPVNSRVPLNISDFLATSGGEFGNKQQKFQVYLVGADVDSRPFKLKFISVGEGRDSSKVSQAAVFAVDGLYLMKMPKTPPIPPESSDYDEDFWGNMGTVNTLEVARAIITQTPDIKNRGGQGLNKVTIGTAEKPGYLVLDGNFYVNNGLKVYGDVYSTGDLNFCPSTSDLITGNLYVEGITHPKGTLSIGGDAYFKGGVNPNTSINDVGTGTGGCGGSANGGILSVGGNCTIQGDFFYYNSGSGGGLGFHVENNMVMDNGIINLTRQSGNNTDSLSVYGNVYIKDDLTGTIPNANTKNIPFFGISSTSTVCATPIDLYRTNSIPNASSVCSSNQPPNNWGADPLDGSKSDKDLKEKLGDEDKNSCENTPIQFNKAIYDGVKSDNPPNWVHRENKPGSCAVVNNKMKLASVDWIDLGEELQDCWNRASGDELYEDQWLVVYIRNKYMFHGVKPLTSGKYIIVFDIDSTLSNVNELPLPPTSEGAQVMLYLPQGYPGKIKFGGTQIGTGYRYFIFSDGNIRQFDTETKKLHGNVFMNNCAVMNSGYQGNPQFKSEGNSDFVRELTEQGVLCKTQDGRVGCQDDNSGGNPSSSSTMLLPQYDTDRYFTPISPRLKVKLESKNISRDKVTAQESVEGAIYGSILVVPRVLYLGKKSLEETKLSDYYNFLYRNDPDNELSNSIKKETTTPNCVLLNKTNGEPTGTPMSQDGEDEIGIYLCTFNNNVEISSFIVQILDGIPSGRQVKFSTSEYDVTETGGCADVQVVVSGIGNKSCEISIIFDEDVMPQWSVTLNVSSPIVISKNTVVYKICPIANNPADLPMTLVPGGSCEAIDPGQAVVTKSTPKDVTVTREDIPTDPPDWPDCNANWNISPAGTCDPVGIGGFEWRCEEGRTISLTYTPSAGCDHTQIGATEYANIVNGTEYTFRASYKRTPVALSINNYTTNNSFAVELATSDGLYGGTCPTLNSGGQCQITLFHSLPYDLSITGPQASYTYNNQTITLPYTLTPTGDGILAIIEPGTGACVYDPAWCGGIALTEVLGGNLVKATGNGPKCFYATEIQRLANEWNGIGILVNGEIRGNNKGRCGKLTPAEEDWGHNEPECSAVLADVERADGGYYIYVQSGGYQYFDTQGGIPECAEGENIIVSSSQPQPSNAAFKSCAEAGFKASDVPGYNGSCASIGAQDDYNSDLYDCICRGGKDIYQNASSGKLACYESWDNPSGMVKCAGSKVAKQ